MPDNTVTLIGNTTREIDLTFGGNSGSAIASFGIAINNRKKDANGEWVDGDAQFYDVKAFGSIAENIAESVSKGTRVVVTGRLNFQQWEDKNDGGKRSKVEIIADDVAPSLRWATAQVTKVAKQ
jgi:single-strand DNA-binding protein